LTIIRIIIQRTKNEGCAVVSAQSFLLSNGGKMNVLFLKAETNEKVSLVYPSKLTLTCPSLPKLWLHFLHQPSQDLPPKIRRIAARKVRVERDLIVTAIASIKALRIPTKCPLTPLD
jgi:hypothetical protein